MKRTYHPFSALCSAVLICGVLPLATSSPVWAQDPPGKEGRPAQAFISVRVLKNEGAGGLKWSVSFPASCDTCALVSNEFSEGQNGREFFFHFYAPSSSKVIAGVSVKVNPAKVRGVMVGRSVVPFTRRDDAVLFDAPVKDPAVTSFPSYDKDDATEYWTYIETPGVQLIVQHANIKRRRGPYATGPWPEVESRAALNLEFGEREAIRALALDRLVEEQGIGVFVLMGFDTNYPTLSPTEAHADWPPHGHMMVYWSHEPKFRDVGHLYFSAEGLLTKNTVGNIATSKPVVTDFQRGQTHNTTLADGSVLFSHTITPDGALTITTPTGECRLTPVEKGFESGVDVSCDKFLRARGIKAEDDINRGLLVSVS